MSSVHELGLGTVPEARMGTLLDLNPRLNGGDFSLLHGVVEDLPPVIELHGEVEVRGGKSRWSLSTTEASSHEKGVLFIPGFTAIKGSSRPFTAAMAQAGFDTVRFSPVRHYEGSRTEDWEDATQLGVDTIHALQRKLSDQEVRRKLPAGHNPDFENPYEVAHSMGSLSTARDEQAAARVIMGGVGFGSPTLRQLAQRVRKGVAGSLQHEMWPMLRDGGFSLGHAIDYGHYFVRRPSRVAGEARACLREDVRPLLAAQRALGIVIPTAYIEFDRDILVQAGDSARDAEGIDIFTRVEEYGHMAPQVKSHFMSALVKAHFAELEPISVPGPRASS